MTYVIIYRKGRDSDVPVACVRQCVSEEKYASDSRYILQVVKPPRQ